MKVWIISIFLILSACYARPHQADAERVMDEFMNLRFHAPLNAELSGLTDRQLFDMACRSKRVKCDLVLDILKNNNPDFYTRLTTEDKH